MSNTLSIPERTLAQISESTNSINVIGGTDGRKSVYEPLVCRITDHADNDASETGADTNKMALFASSRHGEPWKKDVGITHLVIKANADPVTNATATTVTVLFPNFDYTTFN